MAFDAHAFVGPYQSFALATSGKANTVGADTLSFVKAEVATLSGHGVAARTGLLHVARGTRTNIAFRLEGVVPRPSDRALLHDVIDPPGGMKATVLQFGIAVPIALRSIGLRVGHVGALVAVDTEALQSVATGASGVVPTRGHGMNQDPVVGMDLQGS